MSETNTTELLAAAAAVDRIEVRKEQAPDKSEKVAGPFYTDEVNLLVSILKRLPREAHFVALGADGLVNIYRRSA